MHRCRLNGSKMIKIFPSPKERDNTEYKPEIFATVYKKPSGKDVALEHPQIEACIYRLICLFDFVHYPYSKSFLPTKSFMPIPIFPLTHLILRSLYSLSTPPLSTTQILHLPISLFSSPFLSLNSFHTHFPHPVAAALNLPLHLCMKPLQPATPSFESPRSILSFSHTASSSS